MVSMPYPLRFDCPAYLEGMTGMPYPLTICKDNTEALPYRGSGFVL